MRYQQLTQGNINVKISLAYSLYLICTNLIFLKVRLVFAMNLKYP
ncbi:hypothetical protein SC1083_1188 [Aggregatibacter actinomycetemcomitans serotype e str. SC1083]|uniref:Uncharacterized protein n=1 Tax=Aggregatibacter actinomycetemcomitans serotype e str. SC1083 TaxID=907488 RepID=G4A8N6_AGGAC|nr:hypothetical protein SC1083_1188 [Aggregatibacter actinomycetemcomitans serotype e str. SC1083]